MDKTENYYIISINRNGAHESVTIGKPWNNYYNDPNNKSEYLFVMQVAIPVDVEFINSCKLGQRVQYNPNDPFVTPYPLRVVDKKPDDEIIKAINLQEKNRNEARLKREEKYRLEHEEETRFTTGRIISDSVAKPDKYIIEIVDLLKKAIDFERETELNAGREFKPLFDDDTYRKVILSLYEIVSEIVAKGETYSFILYNYGGRSKEYEALREKLSQKTGLSEDLFTSAIEHSMRREDYFNGGMFGRSDHFITMAKLKMQKPQVIISSKQASYCSDISESDKNPPIVIINEKAVSHDDSGDGR